jgi:Na+/pantothenate symporter
MAEDPFEEAEIIERNSTLVILVFSLAAMVLLYSGGVKVLAGGLGIGEGAAVFIFAAVVNLAAVLYQVNAGKVINRKCGRPYV